MAEESRKQRGAAASADGSARPDASDPAAESASASFAIDHAGDAPNAPLEVELRDLEERLRVTVDQAPIVIWTVDRDLRFTSSRGGGLAALGLKADEVVGMTLPQFFGTDDPEYPGLAGHRAALGGMPASYEQTVGGRVYATHLEPRRDADDVVVGVGGVAHDVTESRATEAALCERARMLSTLFDNLPGMVYRCANDPEWTMEFVSENCRQLTGYAPDDLVASRALGYGHLIHPMTETGCGTASKPPSTRMLRGLSSTASPAQTAARSGSGSVAGVSATMPVRCSTSRDSSAM